MLLLADQYPLFLLPSQRIPVLGSFVVVIVLWVLFVFFLFFFFFFFLRGIVSVENLISQALKCNKKQIPKKAFLLTSEGVCMERHALSSALLALRFSKSLKSEPKF